MPAAIATVVPAGKVTSVPSANTPEVALTKDNQASRDKAAGLLTAKLRGARGWGVACSASTKVKAVPAGSRPELGTLSVSSVPLANATWPPPARVAWTGAVSPMRAAAGAKTCTAPVRATSTP